MVCAYVVWCQQRNAKFDKVVKVDIAQLFNNGEYIFPGIEWGLTPSKIQKQSTISFSEKPLGRIADVDNSRESITYVPKRKVGVQVMDYYATPTFQFIDGQLANVSLLFDPDLNRKDISDINEENLWNLERNYGKSKEIQEQSGATLRNWTQPKAEEEFTRLTYIQDHENNNITYIGLELTAWRY